MSAAAITADGPESLRFAKSESKSVGYGGRAMQMLRDNAPPVVAGLKLAGDVTVGFSLNPFLLAYTAFAGAGRVVSLIYGSKANQQRAASEISEETKKEMADTSWWGSIKKALHPKQYPVESSAGLSVIAE